jgi:protein-L-isoaspartate(D-aspartate) O-methyltransferase
MVLPLTVNFATEQGHSMTDGAIFLITRHANDPHHFAARCMSGTRIYPCAGMRDEASEKALIAAFEKDGFGNGVSRSSGLGKITRLYRTDDIAEERCWVRAPGWSLAYE